MTTAEPVTATTTRPANAKMLGWALALTSTYLIAEVIGGFAFNSLALLSDAAHNHRLDSCRSFLRAVDERYGWEGAVS